MSTLFLSTLTTSIEQTRKLKKWTYTNHVLIFCQGRRQGRIQEKSFVTHEEPKVKDDTLELYSSVARNFKGGHSWWEAKKMWSDRNHLHDNFYKTHHLEKYFDKEACGIIQNWLHRLYPPWRRWRRHWALHVYSTASDLELACTKQTQLGAAEMAVSYL